jgi:hypothetical protein
MAPALEPSNRTGPARSNGPYIQKIIPKEICTAERRATMETNSRRTKRRLVTAVEQPGKYLLHPIRESVQVYRQDATPSVVDVHIIV